MLCSVNAFLDFLKLSDCKVKLLKMQKEIVLRTDPRTAAVPSLLKDLASAEAGVPCTHVQAVQILKKSLDARQRQIAVNLTVRLYIDEPAPQYEYQPTDYPDVSGKPAAIVVGAGPPGMFAALRLIELGIRPVVIERGRNVVDRRRDVAMITREQRVDPESNFCFGEGGAGAFSDGKLFTRSKKRGSTQGVLERLCQFGADTGILMTAHLKPCQSL